MLICAYCKSRMFETDRKCQACGSTVFVTEEEPDARSAAEKALDFGYLAKAFGSIAQRNLQYETMQQTVYGRPIRSTKNRWIALVFCALGGFVGVHRFYVGKVGTGILYMLTGGLFGIGAAVDFLIILLGHFKDGQGLPLHS